MNKGNITKAAYQADIKRKQAFFNRCMRRCKVAKTTGEKTFLKNEAKRICTELKTCSKNWKNFGFGGCTWITKNFTMTNFNSVANKASRVTGARKTSTKSSSRSPRSSVRGTTSRKSRTGSRTRTSAARRSYVAW